MCSRHFEQEAKSTKGQLSEFLEAVPYASGDADVLAEVETFRQGFNRRVAQSEGDVDEIRAADYAAQRHFGDRAVPTRDDDTSRSCRNRTSGAGKRGRECRPSAAGPSLEQLDAIAVARDPGAAALDADSM